MSSYFEKAIEGLEKIAKKSKVVVEDLVCIEPVGGKEVKCYYFNSDGDMEVCDMPELAEGELTAIAILGANGALRFTQDTRTAGQFSHLDGEEFRGRWQEVTKKIATDRQEKAVQAWLARHTEDGVELAATYTTGPKIETTAGVVSLCTEAERPFRKFFFSPKTGRPVLF